MNDLCFLEKLLNGAGFVWIPLEQLGQLVRGNGLPKSDFTESGIPAIHYGQIYTTYRLVTHSTMSFVSHETADSLQKVETGDVIITNTSENFEDVATPLVYFGVEQAVTGGHATIFKPNGSILGMFLAYFMQTPSFEAAKRKYAKGAKVIDVSAKDLAKIGIPIPCPEDPKKSIAIQAEIVRVLDKFTELTAELTAELDGRKRQYKHYRDKILTFEGVDVSWKTLDEIGEFIRGRRFTKADYVDDGISAIHYGEIYTHYGVYAYETLSKVKSELVDSLRYAEKNDVVIAGVSETVEDVGKAVAWLGDERVAIHDDSFAFRHTMNPKFIAYAMQTEAFHREKAKHVARGKIKRLLIDGIKKVRLPIPYADDPEKSLAEQARIVAILDKFDTLTTSLSEGLPREIELRNRQYEYYRDLLLSFPKPEEMAEA
ncbi:restriction endonuclease subunit S [Novosphingobium sp. MBES04]|uniref:restriction endonuclease subunit S n=1 Tax=Novosphingobium sp. MBES04 TaxID=1206458 RepID=UPI00057CA737|nr:restriction endonuclease subunit S [Novosphingobium sp. MBES04]